jgi:hypothetical protein
MEEFEEVRENEIITTVTLPNGKTFPRKKYSEYSKEELVEIIGCCKNISEVINTMKINSYYHKYLSKFIKENNIDISHFSSKHRITYNIQDALCKNGMNIHSGTLKRYLLNVVCIENKCSICSNPPEWNNKPLSLQLDHINGDHYDNRVENLRLICPNCHSQTETYTGRNLKKYNEKKCSGCDKKLKSDNTTLKCGNCIKKDSDKCTVCYINKRVVNNSKCTPCSKLEIEERKCKGCNKILKRGTNLTGYHKKCHIVSKIEKE